MCEGFLRHFGKILPLEESFTDWLVVKLRPLRKQKLSLATFHSHYLEEKKFNEEGERKKTIKEYFIRYRKVLHEQQKLQNQALLLPSNQTCNINQLNSTHLSQTLIIFESIDVIFS